MGFKDETIKQSIDRPTTVELAATRLCVVYPPAVTRVVAVGGDELLLGRDPGPGGLALDDPTVSRRHLAIAWDAARRIHTVRDLGSSNGSRVGGRRLEQHALVALGNGDVLRIGDVVAVLESGEAVDATDAPDVSVEAIPGQAASTIALRAAVSAAGPDPSPVLLVGETGSGKEQIARELHRLSQRTGPFLAVNCAGLSRELVESQLFGHEKGAFTGAHAAHDGLFRGAHRGTLLLDEIGELPLELQPKLLRVLQEREVLPVGATRPVRVDVRVVAATHKDLAAKTLTGGFRLDLLARLSLWEIRAPALRDRRVDMLMWLERIRRLWHAERGMASPPVLALDAESVERLLLCDLRDNLRGIHRLVHRLAAGGDQLDAVLRAEAAGTEQEVVSSPPPPEASAVRTPDPHAVVEPSPSTPRLRRTRPSREELERALVENGGSLRSTARHLGLDRRQLYRWLEHYGMRSKD